MSWYRSPVFGVFGKQRTSLSEQSLISEIEAQYPGFTNHLKSTYTLDSIDTEACLNALCKSASLPPPSVLLANFQLKDRMGAIRYVSATDLKNHLTAFQIFDVRESWERRYGSIPNSLPLTQEHLKKVLSKDASERPIVLYCHFGVRSLDAASLLVDKGMRAVYVLEGGIEAWAKIDSSIQSYEHAWC